MLMLLDDRAGSKELLGYLPPETAELTRLDSADVGIVGHGPKGVRWVGVEVKTISDFLSSSRNGRLQGRQLPQMFEDYDEVRLLLIGRWQAAGDGRVMVESKGRWVKWGGGQSKGATIGGLEGLLLTLEAYGVRVKWVEGYQQAADWLYVLAKWNERPFSRHKSMKGFDQSRQIAEMPGLEGGELLRARVANCLPGLGYEKAVKAARRFGSVREMVEAGEEEWVSVEGVGKTIAQRVMGALWEG